MGINLSLVLHFTAWRQFAALPPVLGLDLDREREPLERGSADLESDLAPHRVERKAGDSDNDKTDDEHCLHAVENNAQSFT